MNSSATQPDQAHLTRALDLLRHSGVSNYEAVLCFGSYVRGGWDGRSDIDLLVVSNRYCLQKRLIQTNGITLDVTEAQFSTLEALTSRRSSQAEWLEVLGQAVLIDDLDGRTTMFLERIRDVFAKPDPVSMLEIRMAKATVANQIRKLSRCQTIDWRYLLSSHAALAGLYTLHCHLAGVRPFEFEGSRVAHAERAFPDLARLSQFGAADWDSPRQQIDSFCAEAQRLLDRLYPSIDRFGIVKHYQTLGKSS